MKKFQKFSGFLLFFICLNSFGQWTQSGSNVQLTNPSNSLVLGLTSFGNSSNTINTNTGPITLLELKNSYITSTASARSVVFKLSSPSSSYNFSVEDFPACGSGLMHIQFSGVMPNGQIPTGMHISPNSIVFSRGYSCSFGPNSSTAEYQFNGSTWAKSFGIGINNPTNFNFAVNGNSYFNGIIGLGTTTLTSTNNAYKLIVNGGTKTNVLGVNMEAPTGFNLGAAGNSYFEQKVAIGTTNTTTTLASSNYLLFVNGGIIAKEVRVTTFPWPDYVFANDYKLMSLSDVKDYITQHAHLPGVPSACEIEENGVATGEMLSIQMKKIEELTLYIIQMEERLKSLELELKK